MSVVAVAAEADRDTMIELQWQRLWNRSEREKGSHMKRVDVDSSRRPIERMNYTQLGKIELCDVGYRKEGYRGKEIAN